jgi:hypothetical protein
MLQYHVTQWMCMTPTLNEKETKSEIPDPELNRNLLRSISKVNLLRQVHTMCDRVVEYLDYGLILYSRGTLGDQS